ISAVLAVRNNRFLASLGMTKPRSRFLAFARSDKNLGAGSSLSLGMTRFSLRSETEKYFLNLRLRRDFSEGFDLGIGLGFGYPPPPTLCESLAWRGFCKMSLQNL